MEFVASTPLEHFAWASALPPVHQDTKAPLSQNQCDLLRSLTVFPEQVYEHITRQLQYWSERKTALAPLNEAYRSTLSTADKATLGQLDLFLMEEMLVAAGHVDTDYVKDLSQGFPVTGRLPDGECGRPIPGGQRVHGKPGQGGPEPLEQLRAKCLKVNQNTLKLAHAKTPSSAEDWALAHAAWEKIQKDIAKGYAGKPVKVSDIDLQCNLLVDTFGIYERHAGQDWKIRLINNFRRNAVNDYAWLPSKMQYDNFDQLLHAARVIKNNWAHELHLGKADFKSAFKTLPPSADQEWLCWYTQLPVSPRNATRVITGRF